MTRIGWRDGKGATALRMAGDAAGMLDRADLETMEPGRGGSAVMTQPLSVGGQHRRRILSAASALTIDSGWASVTMGRLAELVGVSRQTVYNEIGSKTALAEAMILDELDQFLTAARKAFDRHPVDLVAAIRDAVYEVLTFAEDNVLLRAIVSATHGADTELLPLLTTHAGSLLAAAKIMVQQRVADYYVPFSEDQLSALIDAMVRTVLSHVMQPSDTPARTAAAIALIAERVLRAD